MIEKGDGAVRTVSHQPSAGVLSGAAHIGPAGQVVEIETEAILRCVWLKKKTEDKH
jgi:hypothetical protein